MAENKTQPTKAGVTAFLNAVEDRQKRADCRKVAAMMRRATGKRAKMWGPSIVGFGTYHYKYDSGREGDFMLTGFSPRKQALTVYVMAGFSRYDALMKKLGKHKTGKSCLYFKRLADVDERVLEQLISESVGYMRSKYETW
ncbi:MAG: DUF1801 domain-containing protein [Gammaproteobacteria bacterium]|nr:DUF1801 domain-containing protein [Gammaproteobacteria bacterium]NNF48424.1 DUF1801 domain-containing protein [Woeseiaceae bacterium]MBT8093784.1 DUF1801 domain-containing protein [Gammaproteobacteria bacterium]MBT8104859.1 DUF1801 domain-containing protein [Gammaproteobacteria bacterium]NNK24873.1 DUF1801 domain-containing protein [Woeseiaceae bacterium]